MQSKSEPNETTLRHANREAWRIYWRVILKHWKRGNWHHRPEMWIAWRAADSGRWICLGCPINRVPRWLRKHNQRDDTLFVLSIIVVVGTSLWIGLHV